MKKEEVLTVFI